MSIADINVVQFSQLMGTDIIFFPFVQLYVLNEFTRYDLFQHT
jgi:hypothetical protein